MKRNAIIRIVLWSVVLFILVTMLLAALTGVGFNRRYSETEMVEQTYAPRKVIWQLTLADPVTVHSSPNLESSEVQIIPSGTYVEAERKETVNGTDWAYIITPVDGWVVWDTLKDGSSVQETGVSVLLPEPGEKNSFHASELSEIEIEWVAGDILIQPGNTDQIQVREDGSFDGKYAMVLKQQGNKLKISFCQEGLSNFIGISQTDNLAKDLTVTVPMDWVCQSLEIDAASASVEINDMTIREVDFDGASGTCEFDNCNVEEIDIDTASGDIRFVGSLDILDCDAASASVYAVLSNVPSRLDMDTMSGDLDITLPEGAGFSLSIDSMNADFTSDFETTVKNGNHVAGDGACRIQVSAMSGDVTIRKTSAE